MAVLTASEKFDEEVLPTLRLPELRRETVGAGREHRALPGEATRALLGWEAPFAKLRPAFKRPEGSRNIQFLD